MRKNHFKNATSLKLSLFQNLFEPEEGTQLFFDPFFCQLLIQIVKLLFYFNNTTNGKSCMSKKLLRVLVASWKLVFSQWAIINIKKGILGKSSVFACFRLEISQNHMHYIRSVDILIIDLFKHYFSHAYPPC